MHSKHNFPMGAAWRRGVTAPALALAVSAAGCLAPEPIDREEFLMAVPADAHLGRVELVRTDDETLERIWITSDPSNSAGALATRDLARLLAGFGALLEASMPLDSEPQAALPTGSLPELAQRIDDDAQAQASAAR
ncbi:MAG: hypothetical protein ACYS26_02715 [Planctomycetota bacterium]|jgi:hypothetical protein